MITKVTSKNELQYQKLFREAEEVLKLLEDCPSDEEVEVWKEAIKNDPNDVNAQLEYEKYLKDWTIGDIYTYFIAFPKILEAAALKDKNIETKVPGDDFYWQKYFSILPLDEPVFTVNANTRTISIPSEFKNIGVVGDNTAEIIFFEIDRFFDAVDFGAEQIKAVIEWHHTGSSDEVHADEAYIKELTLKKDKILIGWVIDKELTEEAGSIEFSLRLYMEEPSNKDDLKVKDIIYSFSTLPAKVNIGKTLNFYGSDLSTIDTNKSSEVLNRIRATLSPELNNENTVEPPEFSRVLEDGSIESTNVEDIVGINKYSQDENGYYIDFNEDTENSGKIDGVTINSVVARSVIGNDISRLKYQWKRYSNGSWLRYSSDPDKQPVPSTNGNVVTIKDTGKYKCEVSDNVGIRFGIADSQILYILEPQRPQVKIAEEGNDYISKILIEGSEGEKLTVLPGLGDKFYTDDDGADVNTSLSFEWKKNDKENKESEAVEITKQNGSEYIANAEGYYYGYAITERNLVSKKSDNATIYRVTEPLDIPTEYYTVSGIEYPTALQGIVNQTITIDFHTFFENGDVNKEYKCDKIKYKWFRAADDLGGEFEPVDGVGSQGETTDNIIHFKPSIRGHYTVKLLINRNGQTLPENNFDEEDPSTWYQLQKISDGKSIPLTIKMADKKN